MWALCIFNWDKKLSVHFLFVFLSTSFVVCASCSVATTTRKIWTDTTFKVNILNVSIYHAIRLNIIHYTICSDSFALVVLLLLNIALLVNVVVGGKSERRKNALLWCVYTTCTYLLQFILVALMTATFSILYSLFVISVELHSAMLQELAGGLEQSVQPADRGLLCCCTIINGYGLSEHPSLLFKGSDIYIL